MTQAISVYISKATFGLAGSHLDMILNLEQQKYITIWNKTTTTQYLMSVVCPTYSGESACVTSRSVRAVDNTQLHFTLQLFSSGMAF